MSIASFAVSDSAIAAQIGLQPESAKKVPPKRMVIAIADTIQAPEPR